MVFSKGWFCIRLHCSINVCLRLFTAGCYVVTKGKILSLALFFCVKADGLSAKLTPERDLSCTVCQNEFNVNSVVFSEGMFAKLSLWKFFERGGRRVHVVKETLHFKDCEVKIYHRFPRLFRIQKTKHLLKQWQKFKRPTNAQFHSCNLGQHI